MKSTLHEQAASNPLLRKLSSIADLSDEERQAVLDLPVTVKVFEADTDIIQDGDRSSDCALVLSGFVCRYKILPDGKRQIMGFYIPGDIPDLQSLHLHVMDSSVGALARSSIALIRHQSLRDMLRRHPNLSDILWRDTLIDAAMFREWMIGLGRRSAYQRMAHVLCELQVRMKAVGLARENGCELPITQNEFADALGLSTVHVNRVLQDLRRDGLIVLRGSMLEIPNWEALQAAGEFDPAYLHLKR
ncbi:Crp/Fnr family transcriptional regulator [Microvirga sp. KLBC 81]|uniref:Crp/Fnr family transcriptional regulator n=1 Tax=Microvirga sp. KLBC 81 TaxID=1862707 RepID=UPI000D50EA47|nr:Crp/Fnr family transcriptional regulator [Microvirga sp. KLBC 81]PVE20655.1 Crp/Fnr family transcriptional regulator [Microvirga sp. KLBC 81]